MNSLSQDLRYAARSLRRNPGFTVVAVLTLALGIGATTAIFSVVNALLLRPPAVHEPDRLVSLSETRSDGSTVNTFSYPHFRDYREASGDFLDLVAEGPREFAFSTGEEAEVLFGSFVSGNYFELLGLRASRGRLLRPNEPPGSGADAVVVLSHDLWQRHFGGDAGVIGRTVRINSQPLEVVGVAPAGFDGTNKGLGAEFWVPLSMYPALDPGAQTEVKGRHVWLAVFGRLRPGVSDEQARAALGTVAARLEPEIRDLPAIGVRIDQLTGVPANARPAILGFLSLLLATALLVLVIASVNVAGMLLARGAARRQEMAIRLAIGAGRARIVRQLLTESVLLFLLGGAGGVLLAFWLTDAMGRLRLPVPVRLSLG